MKRIIFVAPVAVALIASASASSQKNVQPAPVAQTAQPAPVQKPVEQQPREVVAEGTLLNDRGQVLSSR